MKMRTLAWAAVIAIGGATSMTRGDYIADRRAAEGLSRAGQRAEALEAFQKLADSTTLDEQKSDALGLAVREATVLKRDDLAMELAQRIPLKPRSITAQLRLLDRQRMWKEAIEQFGEEDIDAWPDSAKGEGSFFRGQCYMGLKQGEKAAADFQRAVEYTRIDNDKALYLNSLADTYRLILNDPERARKAYEQVFQTKATYKQCHAAVALAGMASAEGDHARAIAELSRVPMDQVEIGTWPAMMHAAWGRVHQAANDKDKAIASFKAALEAKEVPAWVKKQADAALEQLGAAAATDR